MYHVCTFPLAVLPTSQSVGPACFRWFKRFNSGLLMGRMKSRLIREVLGIVCSPGQTVALQ